MFSGEGISQQAGRSNNFFDWSDIHLAREYEEMFLLYISKHFIGTALMTKGMFYTIEFNALGKLITCIL
jgi:hypothetical protein